MNFIINTKSLFIFIIVFILFTAVGTVSHEYGHIVVAKYFGFETVLHYGSMNYYPQGYLQDEDLKALQTLSKENDNTPYNLWPENIKKEAEELSNALQNRYSFENSFKNLWITIGGPFFTVLTGTFGLIILILRKRSFLDKGLKLLDWFAVFLALFWLREVFNLVYAVGEEILVPNGQWFGGDEANISAELNLRQGSIPILLGSIGLLISSIIILRWVPKDLRFTFILGGLIGGVTGFILWFEIIGPVVLP